MVAFPDLSGNNAFGVRLGEIPTPNVSTPQGTSFPTSPVNGQRFSRSDRGIDYQFNGTNWLSVQDYVHGFGMVSSAATTQNIWSVVPFLGVHRIYMVDWTVLNYRNVAGEWDTILSYRTAASSNVVISTRDGSADPNVTWVNQAIPIAALLPEEAVALQLSFSEIVDLSTLNASATLRYKLLG